MTTSRERRWNLRSRRGGVPPRESDGKLHLDAEVEWVFTSEEAVAAEVAAALPRHAEEVAPGTLLIRFGNAVGRLELPHLGAIEISSGKWGEPDFERMLSGLVEVASNLPYSAGEGPLLPFCMSAGDAPAVDYHAFVYLRHALSDAAPREDRLLPTLERIVRDPHRRWNRETHRVPLEALGQVDAASVAGLFESPLHRPHSSVMSGRGGLSRLADRLGGHLPETLPESRVRAVADTPENRFVKRFLDESLAIVARAMEVGRASVGAFGARLVSEAQACGRALERVRRASLWSEVGEMHHLPASSTVLRNRRGYREVLGHWVRLRRTAELPLAPEDAAALLELKDIALLYELWCYFQVVKAVTGVLGPPERSTRVAATEFEAVVTHEFVVEWNGVRLAYNGRFGRSASRRARRAYSLPLRPDVVLEDHRRGAAVVHLLDAKFRMRPLPGPAGAAERLGFKAVDVHKMHAYKDAIRSASSAWVLYPGTLNRWFPEGTREAGMSGVGVVGLVPGKGSVDLGHMLERVLGVPGEG